MCADSPRSRSLTRAASRPIAVLLVLATLLAACGDSVLPFVPSKEPTAQPPRELTVIAMQQGSSEPIPGATLTVGDATAVTGADGTALVTAPRGADVAATADGYDPASGTVPDDGDLTLTLRSNVVSGTSQTEAGGPGRRRPRLRGRADRRGCAPTSDGTYALPGVPEQGTLIYKLAGLSPGRDPARRRRRPRTSRWSPSRRARCTRRRRYSRAPGASTTCCALIDRTEANAMVIDVKETGGTLYYATDLPAAERSAR